MFRARKVFYNEEEDFASDDSRKINALLLPLISLYHYRELKAELAWLKQKQVMATMARERDVLQVKSQQIARHNGEYFSTMSTRNAQRSLSLREMRKWLKKEQKMAQHLHDTLSLCQQQEANYARQCAVVASYYQVLSAKRKRQQKFRFILENIRAL